MDDTLLQELRRAKDAAEKAAIVAEFILQDLPPEIALVARRCVLLHWFDESIIIALTQDTTLSADDIEIVYEHIASLPFIETVSWGLTFQDLTREGLLRRYTYSQQELLRTAARLAAPAYEAQSDEKIVAEAFFCHMIAGNRQISTILLNTLLTQASSRNDWQHIDNLLHLQEEAEAFPFVQPLLRTEQQWLLRGLVHSIQGKRNEAVQDYGKALTFNSKNALTYLSRGTTYAQQEHLEPALSDYKKAIRLDPTLSQAYLNRGIIYTKRQNYKQALKDFNSALQHDPDNTFILQNQGNTLYELGHFEDALATYQKVLNIDPYVAETYIGKAKIHIKLEQYAKALAAYEQAIQLDENAVDAYIGKGKALLALERYEEALATYEEAIGLIPNSAKVYMGKGKALSRLKRYEKANIAFNQARQLDPNAADEGEEQEHLDTNGEIYNPVNTPMKAKIASSRGRGSTGVLRKPSHLRQRPAGRGQSLVWYRLNRGLALLPALALLPVTVIIIFSLLIFLSLSTFRSQSAVPVAATAYAVAATGTAGAAAATATALEHPYPHGGTLLYNNTLSSNSKTFPWVPGYQTSGADCSFVNGALHIVESNLHHFYYCVANKTNFSNFMFQAQMTILKGNAGGIIFRDIGPENNYFRLYYFSIGQDGSYSLQRFVHVPANSFSQLAHGQSPFIKTGLGQTHLIAVVAHGNNIDLYVNQQYLASVTDSTYTQGQIGLAAQDQGEPTEVAFSNAQVYALS